MAVGRDGTAVQSGPGDIGEGDLRVSAKETRLAKNPQKKLTSPPVFKGVEGEYVPENEEA